jgi:cytochrome b561
MEHDPGSCPGQAFSENRFPPRIKCRIKCGTGFFGIMLKPGQSMTSEPTGAAGYTPVAKLLHWLVVALLIAQFVIAWLMPHLGRNAQPNTIINLHFSLGIVVLAVVFARLAWRWSHPEPPPLAGVAPWQVRSARVVHAVLYLLLFIIPILGWMNASWRGFDVSVFGLFTLPRLLATRAPGFAWTGDIHVALSWYFLLAFIGVHVVAALYHALVRRDGVLARMLPGWQGVR